MECLLLTLGGYLLGAIPFGLWISVGLRGVDPRGAGSGNIGATNVYRSVGPLLGLLTLILDMGKGWLPALVAHRVLDNPWLTTIAALGPFFGHLFPVFSRFRGGKGVATGAGIFLALAPESLLGAVGTFLLGIICTGYVSVGSLLAALSLPFWIGLMMGLHPFVLLSFVLGGTVFMTHRENLRRLRAGTEWKWRRRNPGRRDQS